MLTPMELKSKLIQPKKKRFYDKEEMDAYLEEVFSNYQELYETNKELKKKIKTLSDGVQYYRSIETTLQQALVLAEKTAKETKDAAILKAEAIEKDANTKAREIVGTAEKEYNTIKSQCVHLVGQFNQYKLQLKQAATAQIELVESDTFEIYSPELSSIYQENVPAIEAQQESSAAVDTKIDLPEAEEAPSVANSEEKEAPLADTFTFEEPVSAKVSNEDYDVQPLDALIKEEKKEENNTIETPSPMKTAQEATVLEPVPGVTTAPLNATVKSVVDATPLEPTAAPKEREDQTLDSLLKDLKMDSKQKEKEEEDPFEFLGTIDDF